MGGIVQLALLLVVTTYASVSATALPYIESNKRSDENIQFGNQQNTPMGIMDETALGGVFPSDQAPDDASVIDFMSHDGSPLNDDQGEADNEDDDLAKAEDSLPPSREPEHEMFPASPWHRSLLPHDFSSRWGTQPVFGDLNMAFRRRRRSAIQSTSLKHRAHKLSEVPLRALAAGRRTKRDLRDLLSDLRGDLSGDLSGDLHGLQRFRRALGREGGPDMELERLLKDVDVVELLTLLAHQQQTHTQGYGRVSYAPIPPIASRYAPQPALFPDYSEDDHFEVNLPPSPAQQPEPRVWRRSGYYGLSAMPGFKKRSSTFSSHNQAGAEQQDIMMGGLKVE